ncbi:MAG: MFS transporter [Acidimicrobiales bacterium]
MELIAPAGPPDDRPRSEKVREAVAHPVTWLRSLTGGAATFPLLMLFGFAFFETVDRSAAQILVPEIRDAFGLTDGSVLAILAVSSLLGLALTVPIAMWADRYNRVRLMLVGAAVFAGFSIGTGLIPLLWGLLLVMRAGAGVGQATIFPTHNSLLSDYYDIPYRPRVYSFHRAAEALGLFIGPFVAGLLGQHFGWRVPFLVLAIPCLVLVVVGLRMKEPTRGEHERRAMGVEGEAAVLEEPPPSFEEAWRMVWRIQSLRRIFYAMPFLAVGIVGFGYLANLLYEQEFGLDAAQRGFFEGIAEPAQLVGLAFSAVVGMRLLRRGPAHVIRFVAVVATVAAGFAAVFALSPTVWLTVLARMGIAASLAAVLPTVFAALSLAIPARARASGFSMAVIFVIPGLIVLPLAGWISTNWGIRWGMLIMVPVFVLAGLIVSSAHKVIDSDIKNVWTSTAARSELLYERRAGKVKQLLVRGLDVAYGDVQILFGVDFEVDQGEIVALLGTNGAGKSTLLKAICGVVQASNGAVIFDGRDVTDAPPHEVAALGVAMVPGGQGVFPSLTVAENLRVATWLERKAGGDVNARMDEVLHMFPILRERLEDPAANLSGGQQQMLALGMAFLSRPKLLAIDELSLGLAPVVVEQLLPVVRAIRDQGTTVILVEQSVNVALTVAETAVFMEKGEIRFRGPTAELLDRPDVLRSVFLEGASKGLSVAEGTAEAGAPGGAEAAVEASEAAAEAAGEVAGEVAGPVPSAGATGGNGHGEPPAKVLFDFGQAAAEVSAKVHTVHDELAGLHEVAQVTGGLEVVDLSVRFGGIRAVNGVSFSVAPGEIVGIIGPNGAGKTTLFDLISGFTSADSGRVALGGDDISGLTPDARARRGLGRSFQDARLFPSLTVEETIAVALERFLEVRDPLNAAMRLPAFQDAEDDMRDRVDELIDLLGIETFRTKFVHELSTGSRRVVDLACVLAHHPSVVLLDEPSSGIAQKEAEALAPLIERIRDNLGASIVVIEHDMVLITAVSNRLVALDQGHVVTIGEPSEVLEHPDVVESYLGNTDAVIHRSGTRTGA